MNRGGVGARSLNIELQAALNPAGDRKVERFGWTFAPGDKVMQIDNDYDKDVYNGDIGNRDVDPPAASSSPTSTVERDLRVGELDMLVPAYAATIHKSQGSEYPAVVIPVMTQHCAMLQRNLLYTGVTRQACRVGRAEESRGHRRPKRVGPATLVEARRVAAFRHDPVTADQHGGLSHGGNGFSQDPQVRQWLEGVEPAWTLLTFDSLRALRQALGRSVRDPDRR